MRTLSADELPLRRHEEPEEHLAASSSGYATEPSLPNEATTMPTSDAAATEHSEETTELPKEKHMIYTIVNALCDSITFRVQGAEDILNAVLKENSGPAASMHKRIEEVFEPIFIHFPNGLKDQSV